MLFFYKLKARPSTSKNDLLYCYISFIVVSWNWTHNMSKKCLNKNTYENRYVLKVAIPPYAGKDADKPDHSCIAGGEILQPLWKHCGSFF